MAEGGEGLVAVNKVDGFADEDLAENRECTEEGRKGGVAVDDDRGNVVDFEAASQISDAPPAPIGMGDDDYLVAALHQALGVIEQMAFDSSHAGVEEIRYHADV